MTGGGLARGSVWQAGRHARLLPPPGQPTPLLHACVEEAQAQPVLLICAAKAARAQPWRALLYRR